MSMKLAITLPVFFDNQTTKSRVLYFDNIQSDRNFRLGLDHREVPRSRKVLTKHTLLKRPTSIS
jgi:hypothetical protein